MATVKMRDIIKGYSPMTTSSQSTPTIAYMLLMALLMSIGALGTDIMLPALGVLGSDLAVANMNDTTLVVTAFFLGMALGQLIVGPLSDRYGRKPIILGGYGLFIIGCVMSMTADNWTMMVAARVLQGFGAAGPRVIAVAMVRDEHQGRIMAKIMSIVMAAFVLAPILAPLIGQVMIYIGGWRATFAALIAVAVPSAICFHLTMHETLPVDRRRPLSLRIMASGIAEIFRTRTTVCFMLAMGFVSGPFIAYLGTARQIYQVTYDVGDQFVLYFALSSIAAGIASLLNAQLVMRLGMRRLTSVSIGAQSIMAIAMLGWMSSGGTPSLLVFMIWFMATIFCVGMIFGNLQALAMQPLGHMAGLGAAIFGAGSTFVSLPISWIISDSYDGTIMSLVIGFAIMGTISLIFTLVAGRQH